MDTRIAFVTGGSRGIGRAIALQLARDGYDIAFCYRNSGSAPAEVSAAIMGMGRRAWHRPCDVADEQAVRQFCADAEGALGEFSLIVNSAGIIRDSPLVTMNWDAWRNVLATNLDGIFNVCRATVFGFMKRKSGCIVNISSISGVYGNITQANYSASKAGIIGLSRTLAKELGPYGVRVNVVAPGFIATDMTAALNPKRLEQMLPQIPLRRIGDVQEVADVVSFIASDRAKYITGQTIQVDGGLVL